MSFKIRERIKGLPNWIKIVLIRFNKFPNIVHGKSYKVHKEFLKDNYFGYDNTADLIMMVNHSIENVPYYKNTYKPISSLKEFVEQFKFIDKEIVLSNYNKFISEKFDNSKYYILTTGGTSGIPLKLYIPKDGVESSTIAFLWENVGYKYNVRASIRFVDFIFKEGKDYMIDPITKEIIFNAYKISDDYFLIIYNTLKKFKIKYIHAYPSIAYEFSMFILKNNFEIYFINSFLSGSENIDDLKKEFIKDSLGVSFYSWYGHSEKLVLGGYCKNSDVYHIEPTYGFFELIDENGNEVSQPGNVGEIVGTTLHNKGMPLIRYRTGDFAEFVGDYCEKCKRKIKLIKNIQGRRDGLVIYDADGTKLTTTLLSLREQLGYSDSLGLFISGLQYIQKEKGVIEILIVKRNNFTDNHDKRLYNFYKSKFSNDMKIKIRYVDKLLRKPNGKFVELISEIEN